MTKRECGSCSACCTAMGILELKKPNYVPCKHLCAKGCSIYKTKPATCTGWKCAWLDGTIGGDERRRPDNLGVLFSRSPPDELAIYEVRPGAFDANKTQIEYLIQKIASKWKIGKRVWFPFQEVNAMEWHEDIDGWNRNVFVPQHKDSRIDLVYSHQRPALAV